MASEKSKPDHSIIKPWYSQIRKQLRSHFKTVESLEKVATQRSESDGTFLLNVNRIIHENLSDPAFSVEILAQELFMSRSQVFRKIKKLTHMSPVQYIRYYRLQRAKGKLESGDYNVSEVAMAVGFASLSHFTRVFKELFGFKPSSLKK